MPDDQPTNKPTQEEPVEVEDFFDLLIRNTFDAECVEVLFHSTDA
jgi:hypothetical protein